MAGERQDQAGAHGTGALRLPCRTIGHLAERLLCLVVLAFMAPSMVVIALLLKTMDRGPVLVAQACVGRGGRIFRRLTFRTTSARLEPRLKALLATSRSSRTELSSTGRLKNDPRLTPLGRFLRLSGLEQAPQLFNVLRGEMSFVGPEPIRPEAVRAFGPRFAAYASVRPGMTGLWQVRRLRPDSFRRRVAMDVLYARRKSVLLDIGIVLAAAPALLFPVEG